MKSAAPTCEKCFLDFQEALEELDENIQLGKLHNFEEKYQKKIIRSFEISHELALNTVGEYLKKMGRKADLGPRDTTVEAFNEDLIDDGQAWLDMIIDRIKSDPLYAVDFQRDLTGNIIKKYFRMLMNFERKMKEKMN
ncbi:nucleotidyltransferase substrate binding protein [Shivajiella indica]|uniref:Nucleotidyltransferase substrate binding protein n=1 Tax=Shivajiella indica TaxID=872115 RepID=A0ABW5BCW6_9BACT